MLRRFKSNEPPRIFPESYWQWYLDSYSKIDQETTIKHTPYSLAKYNDKSNSVFAVQKFFKQLSLPVPLTTSIIALLKSPFTKGDVIKTFHILRIFQLCESGLFLTNSNLDKFGHTIRYLGAENWDNVMCYMDALLFSMFANLESFEPILFVSNSNNQEVDQLRALLRTYVSLLRSGNLITTDLTVRLCELLSKLGFTEAMSHKQQDAAALFEFLTELLSMPLLTFKIDIKHGGKFSQTDDEKFSRERILFVSIPEEENTQIETSKPSSEDTIQSSHIEMDIDKSTEPASLNSSSSDSNEILLEECLEQYFNNTINVERELERELERRASILSFNMPVPPTLGDVTYMIPEDDTVELTEKPNHEHIENIDDSTTRVHRSESLKYDPIRTIVRHRSSTLSIWSLTDEPKQVSLPAWMFLRLLPFYTDDNPIDSESLAKNSLDFANRKPILPICLKRYQFNNSTAIRSQKRIIIPPVINLPNFVVDDIDEETGSGFKLILESAICHRGNSISSGHFISVVRKDSDIESEDPYNCKWYLYDDMKKSGRVIEKTFEEVFVSEWPYMLFYRLVTMEKTTNPFANATSENPFIPKGASGKYWEEKSISVPIPEIPPTDGKFVDVRDKYYWYVLDEDKNYYKEELTSDKSGSTIGLSPQFRRNSQWSNSSNISSMKLDKKIEEDKELEPFPVINQDSSEETLWKKLTRSSTKIDSTESLGENVQEKPEANGSEHKKKHRHHHHFRKKSVSYQKEKCTIT